MVRTVAAALGFILTAAAVTAAQQPQRLPSSENRTSRVVSVVHAVDLHKLAAQIGEQHKARVGISGSASQVIYNVATGLVLSDGHVITRLVHLAPQDKDPQINITTSMGAILTARLIGIDCATGFAVLEVASLKLDPDDTSAAGKLAEGMPVKILSADFVHRTASTDAASQVVITPSIKVMQGRIGADSIYSKARGAMTLLSESLLSRNDSSIVMTTENRVIGIAQYAGFGRAHLFPIEFITGTVAKRVLEKRDSVPAGWLGAKGDSLAQLPDLEAGSLGLTRKAGVIVREVIPNSPAASNGIVPSDIIVGVDGIDIAGTADLGALIASSPAGRSIRLRAIRKGEPIEISVVLGPRPYSEPPPLMLGQDPFAVSGPSERDQLEKRLSQLGSQFRSYQKQPRSKERDEALSELQIEIRQLREDMFLMDKQAAQGQQQPRNNRPGIEGANVSGVLFPVGFVAREAPPQLAEYFGARSGLLVHKVTLNSSAHSAGLQTGDLILGASETEPVSSEELKSILSTRQGVVSLKVLRQKQIILIKLNIQ